MNPVRKLSARIDELLAGTARVGDDSLLWRELDTSVIGRGFGVVVGVLSTGASASLVFRKWAVVAAASRSLLPVDRLRAVAASLLAAVVTHAALQLLERPVGWWWLIVPGMVATFAGVLWLSTLTASRGGTR